MRILAMIAFLVLIADPAKAAEDRRATEAERAQLVSALTAQGCTGGKKMDWDEKNRRFEVDGAMCEGRKHDLKFDGQYKLISKKAGD